MINRYLLIALFTFLPFLELRYSIPIGVLKNINIKLPFGFQIQSYGLDPFKVVIVAIVSNILIGIIVFYLIERIETFVIKTFLKNFYLKVVEKKRDKIKKYIDKYGIVGLALFIGIPLPGSGVYSGAIGAKALGFRFKQYLIAEIIGVIIAAIAVMVISLGFKFI